MCSRVDTEELLNPTLAHLRQGPSGLGPFGRRIRTREPGVTQTSECPHHTWLWVVRHAHLIEKRFEIDRHAAWCVPVRRHAIKGKTSESLDRILHLRHSWVPPAPSLQRTTSSMVRSISVSLGYTSSARKRKTT